MLGEMDVIMLNGRRIVVPKGARRNVIKELRHAHSDLTKMFWTPARATGTLTKHQRKRACQGAKCAKARASEGKKEPTASSRGAGVIPLGMSLQDGEASGDSDWYDNLAADLADPPASTCQRATTAAEHPTQPWRGRSG